MKSWQRPKLPNMALHLCIGSFVETTMPHLKPVQDSIRTYPMACRACGNVEVVPTSVKPAKEEPGKHMIYMLCRACHHRWQDTVTIGTDT